MVLHLSVLKFVYSATNSSSLLDVCQMCRFWCPRTNIRKNVALDSCNVNICMNLRRSNIATSSMSLLFHFVFLFWRLLRFGVRRHKVQTKIRVYLFCTMSRWPNGCCTIGDVSANVVGIRWVLFKACRQKKSWRPKSYSNEILLFGMMIGITDGHSINRGQTRSVDVNVLNKQKMLAILFPVIDFHLIWETLVTSFKRPRAFFRLG